MTSPSEKIHECHRRSIRLHEYDYSENGAYFITVCTHNREHLFGEIENGKMQLNDVGRMIDQWWNELGNRFPDIETDAFVVMPNHIHGIIVIKNPVGAPLVGALFPYPHSGMVDGNQKRDENNRERGENNREQGEDNREQGEDKPSPLPIPIGTTLGNIVGAFKSLTANEYIRRVKTKEFPRFEKSIWQRNYYEHIIRNDSEWNAIREYIKKNPEMWEKDELYM